MSKTKNSPSKNPGGFSSPKIPSAPAPPAAAAETPAPAWHFALVFLLPLLLYARTVAFDFSYHDDDKMIVEKAALLARGLDFKTIFGTDAWLMHKGIELYRPWQSLTYALDFQLGGKSPGVYHAHNVLVFSLGALLFFLFLRRLFPRGTTALWGAGLYSLNFMFVHAVCWVPARGDLWLFVFSMGCLLTWFDFLKTGKNGLLLANAACFFLALLAKESALMLLPVQAVMFRFFRGGLKWRGGHWLWAVLVAAEITVWFLLRKNAIAVAETPVSLAGVLANLRTVPEELAKFFLPFGFSVMAAFSALWTGLGIALLAALGGLVASKKRLLRPEIIWLGLAMWLLPYLPSLAYKPHFTGFGYDYLDHRAFLLMTGLWLILLETADRSGFFDKKNAPGFLWGLGAYFLIFSVLQSPAYRNWESYFENATRTNPRSGLAASNMGTMLAIAGRNEESLKWFEKAKANNPGDPDTRIRLSELLTKAGRFQEAAAEAEFALQKNPNLLKAWQFRGVARGRMGDNEGAIADFETAKKIAPNDAENHRNIGFCLKNMNRHADALAPLTKALELRPDYSDAYFERGFCHGFLGHFAEAKADLTKVVAVQPQYGAAYFFRGRAEVSLGEREAACADFRKALELGVKEAEGFVGSVCGG